MPTKNDNKQATVHIEVRKTGTPGWGEMAARVFVKDGGFALRGEFYWSHHGRYGLRIEFALAEKDEYKDLAAMVVTLYDELYAGRSVRYEGMDKREPVATYLDRIFDARTAKRRAKLLAAETRAYPSSSRPYTVHIRQFYNDSWSVYAYAEGERSCVAQGKVDVRRRKPALNSVYGQSTNFIWAEAGVAAIERAWKENAIVVLESDSSARGQSPVKRVRMRDHCTKRGAQRALAALPARVRKAA